MGLKSTTTPNNYNRDRDFYVTFTQTTIIKNPETPINIDMDDFPIEALMDVSKKMVGERGVTIVKVHIKQEMHERQESTSITMGKNMTLIVPFGLLLLFICALLLPAVWIVNDF